MKLFVHVFFALGFALLAWGGATGEARADKVPDCLNSDTRPAPETESQAWWDRRTPEQQAIMRELPCEERYIAAVCVFLYDPNLKECVNRGVAEKRATAYCQAQGHELLTEELASCVADFKKSFDPPY